MSGRGVHRAVRPIPGWYASASMQAIETMNVGPAHTSLVVAAGDGPGG
jgi:hypothetical protein